MARNLRIAASLFFAVVALALSLLWVRSYYYVDVLEHVASERILQVSSFLGRLKFHQIHPTPHKNPSVTAVRLKLKSHGQILSTSRIQISSDPTRSGGFLGLEFHRYEYFIDVAVPYWLPVLACTGLAAVPWLPLSSAFSLRTLLIATTLVAVVLGLGVWAAS